MAKPGASPAPERRAGAGGRSANASMGAIDAAVVRDAAREIVDVERTRLRNGAAAADGGSARRRGRVPARLRQRSLVGGARPVDQRDRRDRPHEPGASALAAGRSRPRPRPRRATTCCSSSTVRRAAAGARFRAAEDALVELTGAEDALVTNNNAAAVALAVGLAGPRRRRRVAGASSSRSAAASASPRSSGGPARGSSRSERRTGRAPPTSKRRLPKVAPASCSGSTRRTSRQSGFVEAPDAREVAELAHRHGAIVVDDLGSGALLDTARFGLTHEPMPGERLAAGSDVVTFSGDKLVGGPQAGLVVGRADLIARIRQGPAGARDATGQGDARRRCRDARPVPGRSGRDRDPGLADDRRVPGRAP